MSKFLLLTVLALSFSMPAVSQTTELACSMSIGNSSAQSMAVTRTGVGTAYSLTAIVKTERKLSDGNIISGFMSSRQARDSQGRTRVDNPTFCQIDKDYQPRWQGTITVIDPIAETRTYWQVWTRSSTRTATVTHEPSLRVFNPPTEQEEYRREEKFSHAYDHADPQLKHDSQRVEDLGQRNIAGLEASGMRITRTSPAGMIGNSLPLTYVEERWVSDEYRIILLDINDDPIFGKSTYEVTNFTPGEPDASLFQPPADYEIQERTLTQ